MGLKELFNIGITSELQTYDLCKLQIINRLAVICILIDFFLILTNLLFSNWSGIYVDVAALILVLIPTLVLNYIHKYAASVLLFLVGFILAVLAGTYVAIAEGRSNGVEYLLIPCAVAVIVLLEGWAKNLLFVFTFISLIGAHYFRFFFEQRVMEVEFFQLLVMTFVGFSGVYFFIQFFKSQLVEALDNTQKLNADLRQKEKDLTETNNSKDTVFSIIAHDLRTPLNLMESLLDPNVLRDMERQQFLDYQDILRGRVRNLQNTLHNLLGWAKSQLGSLKVQPEIINLRKEVDNVVNLYTELIEQKKINVQIDEQGELSAFLDKEHFNIIFRNLFHNSLKFTRPEGRIHIDLYTKDEMAQLSLSDNGVGMDEKTRQKILSGQIQKSLPGTKGEGGTGFGLSFCNELVHRNSGEFSLISEINKGTKFHLLFPKNETI